jgi:hypothetical protein
MKSFKLNTLEMTRQIRDEHYHLLQAKSVAERIAFYRQKAQQMLTEIESMKKSGNPNFKLDMSG